MSRRQELRETFESMAAEYHAARPVYPREIFDVIENATGLRPPADVLEIGCATGIATIPVAQREYRVTAVELGPALAEQARTNTSAFANVSIVNASFDFWEPAAWGAFDLVFAATAWHWLDPATKYERAHRHLRPGATLAFWSAVHVVPDGGDPFFADIQEVYDEIGESLPADQQFPRPGELPDLSAEITATGLFDPIGVHHFDWQITYNADRYIALLDTFSGHIAMAGWKRDRLDSEIRRRLALRRDGHLQRHWGAALHIARRSDNTTDRLGW